VHAEQAVSLDIGLQDMQIEEPDLRLLGVIKRHQHRQWPERIAEPGQRLAVANVHADGTQIAAFPRDTPNRPRSASTSGVERI
jgi:hypothetical protein